MEVLVRPRGSKAFDKDVAAHLDVLQQLLVVGQGSTRLSVQLRESDFFEQLPGVQDVLEAGKRVVEVPHLGSREGNAGLGVRERDVLTV